MRGSSASVVNARLRYSKLSWDRGHSVFLAGRKALPSLRCRVVLRDRTVLLTLVEQRLLLRLVQAHGRAPAALACTLERRNVLGGECAVRERSQAPAEAPVLGFPGGIEAVRGLRCRLVMEEERSRVAEEYEGE